MSYVNLPPNLINFKYTQGGEYILQQNSRDYKGYYFEFKNETYAGREFNLNIVNRLIKVSDVISNPLDIYEAISGTKIPRSQVLPSYVWDYDYPTDKRYFVRHNTSKVIKEIDENNFNSIKSNPLYSVVGLSFIGGFNDQEVLEAEKQIPGIKTFLDNIYTLPPADGLESTTEIGITP